jgi:putative hemolysin
VAFIHRSSTRQAFVIGFPHAVRIVKEIANMPLPATEDRWSAPASQPLFAVLAAGPGEVLASQRLRYQVFAEEMGARIPGGERGLGIDAYDEFCHHLLVREAATGAVVASTRILTSDLAGAASGFYLQSEFDLGGLQQLPGRGMDVGRTCVRADYRTGGAINVLWTGLARFTAAHRFEYMMGCASIPMPPEGVLEAHALLAHLYAAHLGPDEYRVRPRHPVLPAPQVPASRSGMPPLLQAYLRLGAWACGEACQDPGFAVADAFVPLDVKQVPQRYHRYFVCEPVPAATRGDECRVRCGAAIGCSGLSCTCSMASG